MRKIMERQAESALAFKKRLAPVSGDPEAGGGEAAGRRIRGGASKEADEGALQREVLR